MNGSGQSVHFLFSSISRRYFRREPLGGKGTYLPPRVNICCTLREHLPLHPLSTHWQSANLPLTSLGMLPKVSKGHSTLLGIQPRCQSRLKFLDNAPHIISVTEKGDISDFNQKNQLFHYKEKNYSSGAACIALMTCFLTQIFEQSFPRRLP